MNATEDPCFLVVILDASVSAWNARLPSSTDPDLPLSTFQEVLEVLVVFLQSYLLMHRRNDLAVLACSDNESRFLYPTPQLEYEKCSISNGSVSIKLMTSCILNGLDAIMKVENAKLNTKAPISQALSQALCFINRKHMEISNVQTRMLVIQAGSDVPEAYNSIMNCIFSAQKALIPLDCLCVGPESVFMQQATDVTGGVYCHFQESGVLQVLFTLFLPSQNCRKILKRRGQDSVDFRAACFCHRRLIEIAYVCSVCLSVFCEFSTECSTCGTRAIPNHIDDLHETRILL